MKAKKPKKINSYSEPESTVEIIKSGTYLNMYCPHCRKTLNRGEYAVFKVINPEGEEGEVKLSPYLNVYTRESTISLPEGQEVKDILCPNCGKSLICTEKRCDACGSRVAKVLVAALTQIVEFYICTRVGCHWHGLSEEDEDTIRLDDSLEW